MNTLIVSIADRWLISDCFPLFNARPLIIAFSFLPLVPHSIFQNQLPASGAPVSGMRPGQIKERFDEYVREKTQSHWKFWMVI